MNIQERILHISIRILKLLSSETSGTGYLSSARYVGRQVGRRVIRYVGRYVGGQVGRRVGRQIGRLVGCEDRFMKVYPYRYVGRYLGRSIGKQVGRKVCQQVGRYVGKQVGRQVDRQDGGQLGKQVGRELGGQVGRQVDRQDGGQIGCQVGSNINYQNQGVNILQVSSVKKVTTDNLGIKVPQFVEPEGRLYRSFYQFIYQQTLQVILSIYILVDFTGHFIHLFTSRLYR